MCTRKPFPIVSMFPSLSFFLMPLPSSSWPSATGAPSTVELVLDSECYGTVAYGTQQVAKLSTPLEF